MIGIYDQARTDLEIARKRIKDWADKRRKNPPAFAVGQLVMLNARNIKTKRPAKKLGKKMLGPFRISKVISPNAMRLTLPTKWRIYNSFHISLLELYYTSRSRTAPNLNQVLYKAQEIENDEYEVQDIMDAADFGDVVKYLVKWQGFPRKKDWTWEP